MKIHLHKNARTTPAQRAFIQSNPHMNISELASRVGVSETTVRRWKDRTFVLDKTHTSPQPRTTLTPDQELTILLLRICSRLGLDDLLTLSRRYVYPQCSRSGLNRCLKRYHISRMPGLQKSVDMELKNWRGTYLYYSKIHFPAIPGTRGQVICGQFTIQTLTDCTFKTLFVGINRLPHQSRLFFINRIVQCYPLTVLGIITTDPVVLFNSEPDLAESDVRHNSLIHTYCQVHDMAHRYIETLPADTLNELKTTCGLIRKPELFMDESRLIQMVRETNTRIRLRALKQTTPARALERQYMLFPGSFRASPEHFFQTDVFKAEKTPGKKKVVLMDA